MSTTFEINLTLYTYKDSLNTPESIFVKLGDGDADTITRTDSILMCNRVLENQYTWVHTYPGCGSYVISYEDTTINISAINAPNLNYPYYYISSKIYISPWWLSDLNSVTLEDSPMLQVNKGKEFRYNPTAVDLDGDSLAFELPELDTMPNYWIPGDMSINPVSGEIIWTNPDSIGPYVFSILIHEYEQGIIKGRMIRNFTLFVDTLNTDSYFNGTATWDTNATGYFEYKIAPLNNLQLTFDYNDLNADSVNVSAYGEVFYVTNPATFNAALSPNQANCSFDWTPDSSHGRNHPYIVTFRGTSYIDTFCISKDITLLIYVELPLGIDEQDGARKLLVYPNPAKETINIKGNFDVPATFELYDVTGRQVLKKSINSNQPINISHLTKGLYVWQLDTARGKVVVE